MKFGLVRVFDNSCSDTLNYDVVYIELRGIAIIHLSNVVTKTHHTPAGSAQDVVIKNVIWLDGSKSFLGAGVLTHYA